MQDDEDMGEFCRIVFREMFVVIEKKMEEVLPNNVDKTLALNHLSLAKIWTQNSLADFEVK